MEVTKQKRTKPEPLKSEAQQLVATKNLPTHMPWYNNNDEKLEDNVWQKDDCNCIKYCIMITMTMTDVIATARLHNYVRDIRMMQPWWQCNDK